jgi:methionine-rich copper-binding protein CopC
LTKPVFATLTLLLGLAGAALAHAVLLEAAPAAHASVEGPLVKVRLRFNSRIDAARSVLSLVLPDKTARPLAIETQPSPDTLTAEATGMKSGSYTLRWQVLAADGHITRGEVPFEVH